MSETKQKAPRNGCRTRMPPRVRVVFDPLRPTEKPQEYYDEIKRKFAEARDLRLSYRPDGRAQYTSDLTGDLAKYEIDPYVEAIEPREPINDTVECLFIGGGFSALLTAARLRERGVESIRIVERGGDVGGTWYWNRYPGAACDVSAYDYLPLLDEMNYVPGSYFAKGPEIFAHCQAIARRYDLYDLAVFQTTVTSTVWDAKAKLWRIGTDRGDTMSARFVICANGTLSKPKLSKIEGMETLQRAFLPFVALRLRIHEARSVRAQGQGRRHHRHRRLGRADHSAARQGGEGTLCVPAHAVGDRHSRRHSDRSGMGGGAEAGMAGRNGSRSTCAARC